MEVLFNTFIFFIHLKLKNYFLSKYFIKNKKNNYFLLKIY